MGFCDRVGWGRWWELVVQFMSSIATVITVRQHWQALNMSVVIQPLIDLPFDSSHTMQLYMTWWNRGFPWNPSAGCCCNEVGHVYKHAREPLPVWYWFEMANLTELVMGVTMHAFHSGQCLGEVSFLWAWDSGRSMMRSQAKSRLNSCLQHPRDGSYRYSNFDKPRPSCLHT